MTESAARSLAEVNALSCERFLSHFAAVVEKTPKAASLAAAQRPFESLEQAQQAFAAALEAFEPDAQCAVLRAHPDLGLKLDEVEKLEPFSQQEQAKAGFAALSRETLGEMRRLNATYRERFGFPFIICVKDYATDQILESMRTRAHSTPEIEFEEALRQVKRIAAHRVAALITASEDESS
ncbi:MAG: 2-oxo-4-hydroxy-4-carboxy-5-ureidoimidazoline decarboxylase [Opitutales bacterium]